jgi:hypothetical protein
MVIKPDCDCWKDPEMRVEKELKIDAIGRAIQISVGQVIKDLNICNAATAYIGGSVVAGIVYMVAYLQRGDGESPTGEHLAKAELEILQCSRERLEGARNLDIDNLPAVSDVKH